MKVPNASNWTIAVPIFLAMLLSDTNAVMKKYTRAIIVKVLMNSLLGWSEHSHPTLSNLNI
jgi:hypothetical protein